MGVVGIEGSEPERDSDETVCIDRFVVYLARVPFGHEGYDPDRLAVETFLHTFYYFDIRDVAVGADDTAAEHPPFDPGLVCFGRIAAVFVDEAIHLVIASGKGGVCVYCLIKEDVCCGTIA